ncbi:hypothetical protein FBU30_004903 [Linnemannia zychae]|nr:hypothetical protein FBU30_004903 [Linnemannia zychae]
MDLLGQSFEYGSIKIELDIVPSRIPNESGFIYKDDVLNALKITKADRFVANGRILSFMRDDNGVLYKPERIPCRPGCVIQVIYEPSPQSNTILPGSSITFPISVDNSVDQLNIGSNTSTRLDTSEPLHVHLSRRLTAQIQEYMKDLKDAITTDNRTESPSDDSIIVKRLLVECNKSMINPETNDSEFEKMVVRTLSSILAQGVMTQQNIQKIFDQGSIIQKIAQEVLNLQKQMKDRLILIEKKTTAILTQQLELTEYPIPRLFIVLPEEPVKYDPTNWFRTKFRLHFICECGKQTETKDSKMPNHLHLAKHEGYVVREPTDFFKKYGPFLLLMLEMIKVGVNIVGHVVPALATLKVTELTDIVKLSTEKAKEMIDYSLECIDNQLTRISESSPGNSVNTEPHAVLTQHDLTEYLSDIEGAEGVEL